jgi:hypothetical protein
MVVYTYNPMYLGGRSRRISSLRPAQQRQWQDPLAKKPKWKQKGWVKSTSARVPAYHVQAPRFKRQHWKKNRRAFLSLSTCHTCTHRESRVRTQRDGTSCKPQREASLENNRAGTLILTFHPWELWTFKKIKSYCLDHPGELCILLCWFK